MTATPPDPSPTPQPRRRRRPIRVPRLPWPWLGATVFFYGVTGVILGSFPLPPWVWGVGVAGVLAQVAALAGRRALSGCGWLRANALVLMAIMGTVLLGATLAIALNHLGTDKLDDLEPVVAAWEVVQYSLGAMVVAALAGITLTETGDRLLPILKRAKTSLTLGAIAVMGLGLGGLVGLVAVAGVGS